MFNRTIRVAVFALVIISLVMVVPHMASWMRDATVTMAELPVDAQPHLPGGGTLRISGRMHTDGRAAMFYQLRTPRTDPPTPVFFAYAIPTGTPPTFRLYQSDDQRILGVAQEKAPEEILLLIDLADNRAWPRLMDDDVSDDARDMLDQLRITHPQLHDQLVPATARELKHIAPEGTPESAPESAPEYTPEINGP